MGFETFTSEPKDNEAEAPAGINAREKMSRTTGRGLKFYEDFLEINPAEFEGKTVLNLGAGVSDINSQLEAVGVNPKLFVNLDFAYKNVGDQSGLLKKLSGKALKRENIPEGAVAGDMKNLPFANDSFDTVMGLWSVGWLEEKDRSRAVGEAYRVCKEGGEVKLHPVRFTKETEALLGKYPFLKISKPAYNLKELMASGMDQKSMVGKLKQVFSNFDAIVIEQAQLLNNKPFGVSVGNLIIKKMEGISQEELTQAIEELEKNGLIL